MRTSLNQLSQKDLEYLRSMPSSEYEEWLTNLANNDEEMAASVLRAVGSIPVCSKKIVCQFYGVAPETIDLWVRKGMPVEPKVNGESRFDLMKCSQWIVRQRGGVLSKDDAGRQVEIEYRDEKRRIAELQRRKMEGELYEIKHLERRLATIKVAIRKRLDQIQKAFGDGVVSELSLIIDEVISEIGFDDNNGNAN